MTFGGPHLLAPVSSLLGIRPGMNIAIHHPPPGFLEALAPLPEGVSLLDSSRLGLDLQVLFASRKTELVERLVGLTRSMSVVGCLWVCFPTVSDDPHAPPEDFVRLAGLELGLADNRKVMLGPDWTALRFVWKPRGPRLELPEARA